MTDRSPPKRDHRQEVTDSIVRMLEEGTAPWLRPWEAGSIGEMPFNPTTKKPYHGGNVVGLLIAAMEKGYSDPRWMTYRQAAEKGWQVRKGEKATQIEFWDVRKPDEEAAEGDEKQRPRMIHRVYSVFNGQQIDGIPPVEVRKPAPWEACEAAETILNASGADIRYGGNKAYFNKATDHIQLPHRDSFKAAEGFYGTSCHELIHWSGGDKRLNRPTLIESRAFGDETYAKEELVAEIGSWLLSAQTGIPHDPAQHAAYVAHWIKALKEDKNEIFRASSAAHAATDYLIGLNKSRTVDEPSSEMMHAERVRTSQEPQPSLSLGR